jgi:glycerophosphoryl diester phosphodiesterase
MKTNKNRPLILAHRGLVTAFQENTMASIQAAFENPYCDGAEFDVLLTKDNQVVLFHDENMKRLTGIDKFIQEMTWVELKKIPILADLQVDGGIRHYAKPQPIVLLKDILEAMRGQDFFMDIELRASKLSWAKRHVGREVAKIVRDMRMEDQCVVTSFNYCMLWAAENEHSALLTAAAYDDNMPFSKKWLNRIMESNFFGKWLQSSAVISEYTLLDDDSIEKFTKRNMKMGSFTFFPIVPNGLDDKTIAFYSNELRRLARHGLYWVETDDVELAYRALTTESIDTV